MANRKSGKELRAEYKELLDKTKAMQKRIIKRAEELADKCPQASYGGVKWKDNELMTVGDYKRYYVITPKAGLTIIECVEKYLAEQHPHKQTKIEFPEVVPAPPVGERFIISEGVAYTRKSEEEAMKCSKSPDGKHQFGFDGSTCSHCGANVAYL